MKYPIALFGVGGFARLWVEAVHGCPEVEVAAYIDANPEALKRLSELGVAKEKLFESAEEAMRRVRPWAITCTIPNPAKQSVLRWALGSNIHVVTDKPVVHTVEDARKLLADHAQSKSVFQVAQNYRQFAGPQTIRQVLDAGKLGRPGAIFARFLHDGRSLGSRRWMAELETWKPLGLEMSVHHFDLMRYFLNVDPTVISGTGWRHEWSWGAGYTGIDALIEFPGRVQVNYHADWNTPGPETGWGGHWDITLEGGRISWRGREALPEAFDDEGRKIPLASILVGDAAEVRTEVETLRSILKRLIAAAEGSELPFCSLEENIHTIALIQALEESHARGVGVNFHDYLEQTYELKAFV